MPKVKLKVSRRKLEKAVKTAETNGSLPTMNKLYDAVAELYNCDGPPTAISPAVVRLRIIEWKISTKTTPRKKAKSKSKPRHKPELTIRIKRIEPKDDVEETLPPGARQPKLTPTDHAKRVLARGSDKAKTMLKLAKKHGYWKHVDWGYVEGHL